MRGTPDTFDTLIERYLDNSLTEEERDQFERLCDSDPSLQQALRRQSQIEATLRSRFAPPEKPALQKLNGSLVADWDRLRIAPIDPQREINDAPQVEPPNRPDRRSTGMLRRCAVAAILLLGVFGVWNTWRYLAGPSIAPQPMPVVDLASYYEREVERGFAPAVNLHSEASAILAFGTTRYEVPLDSLPGDVAVLGISDALIPSSRQSIPILAHAKGKPVLLITEYLEPPYQGIIRENSDLNLFHHTIGRLFFYEITPHDFPALLPHLRIEREFKYKSQGPKHSTNQTSGTK